jgi:hypothetical protein
MDEGRECHWKDDRPTGFAARALFEKELFEKALFVKSATSPGPLASPRGNGYAADSREESMGSWM